jgi:UDP-N-acetylmuramoyl-L-alanyl-D-glutamate--2,6-diaminopimelate ligase
MQELVYRFKRVWHYFKTGLLAGLPAQIRYHHPQQQLKIIALTGTDGKTTTATLVYHLLKTAGYRVGLISTVAAYIGDQTIDTGFHVTTAHPKDLYGLMAKMVQAELEYLVLEVTSHGAYQYRTWGIRPFLAGLTNIDREHLDYHLNYQNYLAAKLLILRQADTVVLGEDQDSFTPIKKMLPAGTNILTFGRYKRFGAKVEKAIRQFFPDDFNRLNAALAITLVKKLGLGDKAIVSALATFTLPTGRMEFIPNHLGVNIIVDFAHTPQALENALRSIHKNHRSKRGSKLIAIFGSAGLRDRAKRPAMGYIGAKLADLAIFTAEDPRTENIWVILNQMKAELGNFHDKVLSIPDRRQAIEFALRHYAQPGNTIAIFGKGHEQSMCYGTTEHLWNDITGTKELLGQLAAN